MNVILELQKKIINQDIKLSSILRESLMISNKLQNEEVATFIRHELNGYEKPEDLPQYRFHPLIIKAQDSFGYFHNIQGLIKITEGHNNPVYISVPDIENLLETDKDQVIQQPLDPEAAEKLNDIVRTEGVYSIRSERYSFHHIYERSILKGILEKVRNTLLDYLIELDEKGILGENYSFSDTEKSNSTSVTINIHGNNNNPMIQQGTNSSTQNQTIDNNSKINELLDDLKQDIKSINFQNENTFKEISDEIDNLKKTLKENNKTVFSQSLDIFKNKLISYGIGALTIIADKYVQDIMVNVIPGMIS